MKLIQSLGEALAWFEREINCGVPATEHVTYAEESVNSTLICLLSGNGNPLNTRCSSKMFLI